MPKSQIPFLVSFLLSGFLSQSQQTAFVDFKSAHGNLSLNYSDASVTGENRYEFQVLKKTDTIFLDAIDMKIESVLINGKPAGFVNSGKKLKLYKGFKKGKNILTFSYSAVPKQALYFVASGNSHQIWSQGQGKYTSHWFPSLDDVNDKMVFSLSVSYPKDFTVLSNGKLASVEEKGGQKTWHYEMENPMPSYLLMLGIGHFDKKEVVADSGIVSELYMEPSEIPSKWEPTYRYSKQIFDYLEKETIPYAWGIYRQLPVRDFLYGGMENTTATIFTRDYVVDETGFNDRNYVNVNAHELAHQWFGDMVTARTGAHHWLQEGFATFYALLAEWEIFGDDHYYWKLYENAEIIQQASKTDSIPILNEKASSVSYYQKGAWALHILRETVGEDAFRKGVKNYLLKYRFKNVETDEFLDEIEKVAAFDRKSFVDRWLKNPKFEVAEAIQSLSKNPAMAEYFALGNLSDVAFADKKQRLLDILKSDAYFPIKKEAVYQTMSAGWEEKKEILFAAMETKDVEVRQSVAQSLRKVTEDFRPAYETLLDDKSYITQEIALNSLCRDFPEKRAEYLDRTDGRIGLNDKNIRLLWLTLALKTENYRVEKKTKYYDELIGYAKEGNEASLRQSALQKLLYLNKGDTNVLPLLVQALVHHKWQLTKYARDIIREKLKLTNSRKFYEELLPSFTASQQVQLKKLLDEK